MDENGRITDVADVPTEGTLLFTVRADGEEREAILLRVSSGDGDEDGDDSADGDVVAWLNYCQHWTDVRLDSGDGAAVRNGEVVCEKHGATFRGSDGCCTFGPCEGATLNEVEVAVDDGDVYLSDDEFEFVHLGASEERDLSAGRGIGFGG